MPSELPAPAWLGDFYAAEAQAYAPLPPDIITIRRYQKTMTDKGVRMGYNMAAKRLQRLQDDGAIVLAGLMYDPEAKREVRTWKLANAKAKPNKKARVSKKN